MNGSLRARSGWRTPSRLCVASIFTGDGWRIRCRPRGRSGRVTTAATSKAGDPASADKLGQASSAVPKKRIRSGAMPGSQGEKSLRQKKKSAPKGSVPSIDNSGGGWWHRRHGKEIESRVSGGDLSPDQPRRSSRAHIPRRSRPATVPGDAGRSVPEDRLAGARLLFDG